MASIKLPYIKLRPQPDGSYRPRFSPGERERALGFVDVDLKHDDGRWYTVDEARGWAQNNYQQILARRDSGKKLKAPTARKASTLEALLDDWLAALKKRVARGEISAVTLDSYERAAAAVVYKPETRAQAKTRRDKVAAAKLLEVAAPQRSKEPLALSPVSAIGAPELRNFFDYAYEARGHHMALGMIAAISAAFTWGKESADWRLGANPRIGMNFARPEGRIAIYTLEEFNAMVAAADDIGRPSIGDSYYLGLFTGQRQTDRLLLEDHGMTDGRRQLFQSKTGAEVKIKETPQLSARLAAARVRVAAIKLAKGTRPVEIVVDETTGLAYNDTTYRHWVSVVRTKAAERVPSVLDKRDQDLRDTFVTMTYRAMSRAGRVDLKAICDVSGHSYGSIELIMKHYLGRDARAADQAIDMLADFVGKDMVG